MQLMTGEQAILLASQPVDFRNSIDGLACIVQEQLGCKPSEGVFIFYNRARNRVKILLWHHNGFIVLYKRFEQGKLTITKTTDNKVTLSIEQLNWLLMGVDWLTLSGANKNIFENYS